MNSEGSLVLFYLLDRKLKKRSHVGMCAIACKKIPHLSGSAKSSLIDPMAPQRKNLRLPLFRFTSETQSLMELIARTESKDATVINFLKLNELLFGNIPRLNPRQSAPKIGRRRDKSTM